MPSFNIATERTICFLLRDIQKDKKILLGLKKRGFGKGIYNGFGGKLEPGESAEEAAVRELGEEAGVMTDKNELEKIALIDFHFPYKEEWNQRVHVYFVYSWKGEPVETEEMKPEWFAVSRIPYDQLWDSDKRWLPLILKGKKIEAEFVWKEDNKTVDKYELREATSL